jgi:hypothetical protein
VEQQCLLSVAHKDRALELTDRRGQRSHALVYDLCLPLPIGAAVTSCRADSREYKVALLN